jgi:hypothetical protein
MWHVIEDSSSNQRDFAGQVLMGCRMKEGA